MAVKKGKLVAAAREIGAQNRSSIYWREQLLFAPTGGGLNRATGQFVTGAGPDDQQYVTASRCRVCGERVGPNHLVYTHDPDHEAAVSAAAEAWQIVGAE